MTSRSERPQALYYKLFSGGPIKSAPGELVYIGRRDTKEFDEYRFYRGKAIDDWPEGITFNVRGEKPQDYLSLGLHWMTVSDHVRVAFEQCGVQGVQLLPVKVVVEKTGKEIGIYWALNVFQETDALDWEHSRWLHPERKYQDELPMLDILRIALRFNAVNGLDIFRLKVNGRGDTRVFVSERVKKCLEEAGATSGFVLDPAPAY